MPACSAMAAVVTAPNPRWLNKHKAHQPEILIPRFVRKQIQRSWGQEPTCGVSHGSSWGFIWAGTRGFITIKPKRRDQTQQNGSRIPQRQRGTFFMAVQHLVFLRRLVVVIAVAGQFVQHDSANVGVGIPRCGGVARARSDQSQDLLAQQTVVFDVVDAL